MLKIIKNLDINSNFFKIEWYFINNKSKNKLFEIILTELIKLNLVKLIIYENENEISDLSIN